jgi:cobyric acid synthase
MFQGTSSNAGKSLLTAAFCRILLQDGFHAAPFKAQNMSLNSFVTRDGREMGRAQVVQAQACRLEPDVRMNPILLKPNSDTGCQVIVRGKPIGNMRVGEYVDYKREGFAVACEAYESLAAEFDAVVLEGAGSPGEVNLKSHDIVNMRMARHAGAPVLIVGDIDRGGVFASFVGTMEVLAAWERKLVAGWVINRFRGDAGLLGPALDYMLRHTGRPVLGVVPYLHALNLPEEDSVEFKAQGIRHTPCAVPEGSTHTPCTDPDGTRRVPNTIEIALVDLPHLSNFSDFDAFRVEPDVRLRIVRSPADLDQPDAVLIGGSKNTLGDLAYLRSSGLAERIACLARSGRCEVVGICGGFQMLGQEIRDPLGIESSRHAPCAVRPSAAPLAPPGGLLAPAATPGGEDWRGLGLLAVQTVLAAEKTLLRTTACHAASGLEVTGYEIHHGQTDVGRCVPAFRRSDGQVLGAASPDGRVWGTYLHGVFDCDAFRRWFIDRLRVRRGLPPIGRVVGLYDIEPALDRLAEAVRRALPVERIYRMMGLR